MTRVDVWEQMHRSLSELNERDLLRHPRVLDSPCGATVVLDGRRVVCLCGNDYLCLAGHPAVSSAAVEALRKWGVGAGASRLISGTTSLHVELERRLAEFKHTASAIVTSTGWMANHAAVGALAGRGDLILADKLSHASVIDAARSSGAVLRTYAHCDPARLARMLQRLRARFARCLIVTDSLFSMDGDLAPLGDLVELKKSYDAQLLIDEAHATGVMGAGGRGVAELLGLADEIDAAVGTLSKAIGSLGGFVAGPEVLIETIRNTARAFIYTTALPPALCASAIRALEIIAAEPERRRRLLALADRFRAELHEAGLATGNSASQIVPIVLGPAARAVHLSRQLLEGGFFVPAIRPPTVPPSTSRLRVSLCCDHEAEDLARLVEMLRRAL